MIDKKLIINKLKNIQEYLVETKPILNLSAKEIIFEDIRNLKTMERNFQLIVDEMLDVNIHFIRELELKSPNDFQGTFEILAGDKIIPNNFALKIAPTVGLRNRLVHRYETLDRKFFVESFQKNYSDFEKYIKLINEYLKTLK